MKSAEPAEVLENPLVDKYKASVEALDVSLVDLFRAEGLSKEAHHLAGLVRMNVETFVLECGLVQVVEGLVRVCDQVATVKTADVKDNGLKRTLIVAAREQGIKISLAGDFARHLNSGNVEVQLRHLHSLYVQTKQELEVAARLALQYDGIKVPAKLQAKVADLKEQLKTAHRNYPDLAEAFPL